MLCNPLILHKLHVIKYGSRTLIPAERNYHLLSGNLNFLELKWAICDTFQDYLYHDPTFTVYTNIKPLIYVPRTARLSAVEHRRVGDFHFNIKIIFNIKYRAQNMNTDANTVKAPIKTSGENDRTYRHHVTRSYIFSMARKQSSTRKWVGTL